MKTQFSVNKEKLESTMERVFDAPKDLLWRAHADPSLMAKWWGRRQYEVHVETYEPRVGAHGEFPIKERTKMDSLLNMHSMVSLRISRREGLLPGLLTSDRSVQATK